MGLKIIKVLCEIEYPEGMPNSDDTNPSGAGITTPLTEVSKIIHSGCGDAFNTERYDESSDGVDAIFAIEEVS